MSTLDVMSRVYSLRTSTCLSKNSGETWDADTLTCTVDTTGASSTAQCAVKKAGLTVVTTVSSLSHPRACSPSSLRLVSPQFNCNNRTLAVTRCAFLHTLRASIRANKTSLKSSKWLPKSAAGFCSTPEISKSRGGTK